MSDDINFNIPAISTFAFSINDKIENLKTNQKSVNFLREILKNTLKIHNILYKSINLNKSDFSPYFIDLQFENIKKIDSFLINFDLNNICCTTSKNIDKTITVSFSPQNKKKEIKMFVATIENLINKFGNFDFFVKLYTQKNSDIK